MMFVSTLKAFDVSIVPMLLQNEVLLVLLRHYPKVDADMILYSMMDAFLLIKFLQSL